MRTLMFSTINTGTGIALPLCFAVSGNAGASCMKSLVLLSLLRIGSGPFSGAFDLVDPLEYPPNLPQPFAPAVGSEFLEEGSDGRRMAWMPETVLGYNQSGSRLSGTSPKPAESPHRAYPFAVGEDLFEDGREGGAVRPSATASYPANAIRAILEPLDALCRWENVRAACEKGFPDLSVATSFPGWIDSWGCAIGANSVLSVNFDMMGFEEFGDSDHLILDSRHGIPRLSYLSTSVGFSLKF